MLILLLKIVIALWLQSIIIIFTMAYRTYLLIESERITITNINIIVTAIKAKQVPKIADVKFLF